MKKVSTSSVDSDRNFGHEIKGGNNNKGNTSKIENKKKDKENDDPGARLDSEIDDARLQEEIDAEEEARKNAAKIEQVKMLAAEGLDAFTKAFVDYGPPYEPFNPENFDGADLCLITSDPNVKVRQVHLMLNARADPNIVDPEDMHWTPLMYCARNSSYYHFVCLKMLLRAKARLDATDEIGMSALHLCVMMKHAPDKRPIQIEICQYLCERGADVNIRDKGGNAPIDLAAANNDFELVEYLILKGATCLRDNFTFVGKRKNLLQVTKDPRCYKAILNQINKEKQKNIDYKAHKDRLADLKKAADLSKKLFDDLAKMKRKKEMKEEAERKQENIDNLARIRAERREIAKKTADDTPARKEKLHNMGYWKKDKSTTSDGPWEWDPCKPRYDKDAVWNESVSMIAECKSKYALKNYRDKWQELTIDKGTGSQIEFKWTKNIPFEEDGYVPESINDEIDENSLSEVFKLILNFFNIYSFN